MKRAIHGGVQRVPWLLAALLGLAALVPLGVAENHAAAETAVKIDAKALTARITSKAEPDVVAALGEVRSAGPAAAALVVPIEKLLAEGATVGVSKAAIDALGAVGKPTSSAALRPYLNHRTPDLRRAAVRALAKTKGPEAVSALRDGLKSMDGQVRGLSASGLGAMGAKEALPDLFLGLDRGIVEGASAVGQLCAGADCNKLLGYLGKLPFDVMTSGIDPILFREPSLGEATEMSVVGTVRELGTPEAGKYLNDVLQRWPDSRSAKVKKSLESAVQSIPGAQGG